MKPTELAQYRFSGELPSPVKLEGTLIASDNYSHLIDDDEFSSEARFGILLPPKLIECLNHLEIPRYVGTSVAFIGQASFICEVWQTGYQMLPYRMTQVYEFTYQDEYVGKHSIHIDHVEYDVFIYSPKEVSANTLKKLQPLFEQRFTIMELRKFLHEHDEILLHHTLKGEQLFSVEQTLKELDIKYELRHYAYGKYWPA